VQKTIAGIGREQIEEAGDQSIHLLIAEQDRIPKLRLVLRRRSDLEELRLHMSPIHMLKMSGAVDKERRKMRADLFVIPAEHVELQLVQNGRAFPAVAPPPLYDELLRDCLHGFTGEAVAHQERQESAVIIEPEGNLLVCVLQYVLLTK